MKFLALLKSSGHPRQDLAQSPHQASFPGRGRGREGARGALLGGARTSLEGWKARSQHPFPTGAAQRWEACSQQVSSVYSELQFSQL